MRSIQAELAASLGAIGASQSRLAIALATNGVSRENYLAAASRITDVDIASASAELTRTEILQQVAASILAQANQQPSLALRLLSA